MRDDSNPPPFAARPWPALVTALGLAALGTAFAVPASAQVEPWGKDRQWISIRAGYAKSSVEGAADGNVGGGFAFTRFLNSKWAVRALAELNLLGKFGGAAEIESPWLFEASRHYRWPTTVRPFLGLGAGAYFHKFYRTGADVASVRPGVHVTGGLHTPLSDSGVLGFDVRLSVVDLDKSRDPVFGPRSGDAGDRAAHWSAKLDWAWAF
jgi:hypothetical protein